MGTAVLFPQGYSGRNVKVTCYLHLLPKLRMSGAVPPRHLFALAFLFPLYVLCGVVYSSPLRRTQQAGTSVNSCIVYAYSKDQEFEPRPR